MDPAQKYRIRVIASADRAVYKDEHPGLQKRGIRSYGRDASDGAGAGDQRHGERVLALAIVDGAHVGYHVRNEDAHDGGSGDGLRRWDRLDGGRGGSGC